jgi:hypothetical protein
MMKAELEAERLDLFAKIEQAQTQIEHAPCLLDVLLDKLAPVEKLAKPKTKKGK